MNGTAFIVQYAYRGVVFQVSRRVRLPDTVRIEPVGKCNLNCRMCPGGIRRNGRQSVMPLEMFDSLLDQFESAREVQLQGLGEPLLHPSFTQFIDRAAGRGLKVTAATNLTLLNEKIANSFVSGALDALSVSIESPSEDTYGWLCRDTRLPDVLSNLQMLLERRESAGSGKPRVTVTSWIMRENIAQLPRLVELVGSLGVEAFTAEHLPGMMDEAALPRNYRPVRDFVLWQMPTREDRPAMKKSFEECMKLGRRNGVEVTLPPLRPAPGDGGDKACEWPWREAFVSSSGKMIPCPNVGTPDRCHMGDAASDGVASVWNGPRFNEFRSKLVDGDPPEICRHCSRTSAPGA